MAKVFIEETTLTNIGNAIRDKEGTSELIPVTDMATRIAAIESGGGGDSGIPEEAFNLTGDCSYQFNQGKWDWFIAKYGNQITTDNITSCQNMFFNTQLEKIPFQVNINTHYLYQMFASSKLKECPKVRGKFANTTSLSFEKVIYYCAYIRDFEDLFDPDEVGVAKTIKVTGAYNAPRFPDFYYCYSMRRVPSWFYALNYPEDSTAYPSSYSMADPNAFYNCYVLDEVKDYPVRRCNAEQTANMYSSTCSCCFRLKDFTFETNNGTPYVVRWKGQIISMNGAGYSNYTDRGIITTTYNSGITADKEVTDDASYQALKNDPDWFTLKPEYSRYNHDSAVATINSLPDTSAYLASAGGTNTIKFKSVSGSATDGGACGDLTEEEIAVAAAKGWTVTLV